MSGNDKLVIAHLPPHAIFVHVLLVSHISPLFNSPKGLQNKSQNMTNL